MVSERDEGRVMQALLEIGPPPALSELGPDELMARLKDVMHDRDVHSGCAVERAVDGVWLVAELRARGVTFRTIAADGDAAETTAKRWWRLAKDAPTTAAHNDEGE